MSTKKINFHFLGNQTRAEGNQKTKTVISRNSKQNDRQCNIYDQYIYIYREGEREDEDRTIRVVDELLPLKIHGEAIGDGESGTLTSTGFA